MRQCQNERYKQLPESQTYDLTRCKLPAQGTVHGVNLCYLHLGEALVTGGVWFARDDAEGHWEADFPKQFALKERV